MPRFVHLSQTVLTYEIQGLDVLCGHKVPHDTHAKLINLVLHSIFYSEPGKEVCAHAWCGTLCQEI